ncbi:MAG: PD-(D/E)XK nuclease family protein [Anaerolineae bacterium]|nr:PD-(D/E)XK nuclease family protein [Anaerolineae bacterium]
MSDTHGEDRAKELEALVINNPDLNRLEMLLGEFNIFEAVGPVRQELRHSYFLAFLLDPSQSHGLGDSFLKRFLMRALIDAEEPPISPVEVDTIDMDTAAVQTEWQCVDIFIDDSAQNGLVCAIENKVDSGEHGDQLARYRKIVEQHFPDARQIFIFLTPEGDPPSDASYIPMSYGVVVEIIDALLETEASIIGPDVRTLMAHYVTMLRRYIVSDSDIAELARKIYRRHKRAMDLILECRPDTQRQIADYLVTLIERTDGLVKDVITKSYVGFIPNGWSEVASLTGGEGWSTNRRILRFEFVNLRDQLLLNLVIGPGKPEIRQALYNFARSDPRTFVGANPRFRAKFTRIWGAKILKRQDYEDTAAEDLLAKIDRAWDHFVKSDLPTLTQSIQNVELPDVALDEGA